jgi:hypothetical protein
MASQTMRKALGRAIVQDTVLSAHIARRSGEAAEQRNLPRPLVAYFATDEARVCMRCLLDRPGRSAPLERGEPRPHQYICAACHDDVFDDFPDDLREQASTWPRELREDRIIHRALSRPARVQALHEVLHPLSGMAAEIPQRAAERAVDVPAADATPGPTPGAATADTRIQPPTGPTAEDQYVQIVFDPKSVKAYW